LGTANIAPLEIERPVNRLRSKLEQNLGAIILALLLLGCLLVLRPFLSALLWGSIMSFSLWPIYRRLLGWIGNRPTIAAALLSLAIVAVVLLPFVVVGVTLSDNVRELAAATQRWLSEGLPPPPDWLGKVPIVGSSAVEHWKSLAQDSSQLAQESKRFIEPVASWLLSVGFVIGSGVVHLALSILITFFLLRNGPSVAGTLHAALERIAGERARYLLELAGKTIRGVVYGILGTALVQAVMAGIGFFIAGVPGAALLALLTFFLSVLPVGPPLIWIPAALWLFHQGSTGWGIFMIIWGIGVSTVDNFVKPWLISQGSDMPFLLILFGVLGGALTFGFIGVFIGPTLLAVGHRLVVEWSTVQQSATSPDSPPSLASPAAPRS